MPKVFVSHSSKDKSFMRKLSIDLLRYGHDPWLDEWEIRVGDCIVSGVEGGIAGSDFAIVVLSDNSVRSGWVDSEWKAKYWAEVQKGQVMVLPALLQDCEIPVLLQTKKYADFRTNYDEGLHDLLCALAPADSGRLAFRERVKYVQERVLDLISRRATAESDILFGKPLTYENHPERFAEVTQFTAESQDMYVREIRAEVDGIVAGLAEHGIASDVLARHVSFSLHTMGWRKVAAELGEVARQLERPNDT